MLTIRKWDHMDKIEFSSVLYCDVMLRPVFWKHTDLGVGKVCNAPLNDDGSCPNAAQHAE